MDYIRRGLERIVQNDQEDQGEQRLLHPLDTAGLDVHVDTAEGRV